MDFIAQPYNSNICGHCCVAMIAGVPVKEVIDVIGHTKGTRTRELVRALRHFGKTPATERLQVNRGQLPKICILKMPLPNTTNWHWVVYEDGVVLCPSAGVFAYEKYESKASSYLEIIQSP